MKRTLSTIAITFALSAGFANADVVLVGEAESNLAADLLSNLHHAGSRTCVATFAFEVSSGRPETFNLDKHAETGLLMLDYQKLAVGSQQGLSVGKAAARNGENLPFSVLNSDVRRDSGSMASSFMVPAGSLWQGESAQARSLDGEYLLSAPEINLAGSSLVASGSAASSPSLPAIDARFSTSPRSTSPLQP